MSRQVPTIEDPKKLLNIAIIRGKKAASIYPKQNSHFYTAKGKEIVKIDLIATYIEERLFKATQALPSFETLGPFYKDLYDCIIDTNKLKQYLSNMTSVARLIVKLRRESIIRLKEMRYERASEKRVFEITKSFIGRTASLLKSLKEPIEFYNESAKKLLELPSIKTNEEVILLAGLPNVGKSTLLQKITESKPQIAAYPFTTKGLNVGLFMQRYLPIQVIDTPGLLDRPLHERNQIELKAITALQHLNGLICFIVDPEEDAEKQLNLFKDVKKLFTSHKFLIVINKTDVATKIMIEKTQKEFAKEEVILEGNGLNTLKDYLTLKGRKLFEKKNKI